MIHDASNVNATFRLSFFALAIFTIQECAKASFEEAILNDIIPPSSPRCRIEPSESSFSSTFEFSSSSSYWDPRNAPFESHVFQTELNHRDSDPHRVWRMRVGTGGTIYSLVGAYGESVPPQAHENAPWMDEVWQSVSVNGRKNKPNKGESYFIHQAGTYKKDGDRTAIPFYSPSIISHCSDVDGYCRFGSWGQQAHIPTKFKSEVLYFSSYRDCGDGVIEYTSVIHNAALPNDPESDDLNYLNVPWGGVRRSSLEEVMLSERGGGGSARQLPLQAFGMPGEKITLTRDTGGYTVFVQRMKLPDGSYFRLPTSNDEGGIVYGDDDDDQDDGGDDGNDDKNKAHRRRRRQRKKQQQQKDIPPPSKNHTSDHDTCNAAVKTTQREVRTIATIQLEVAANNTCVESPNHSQQLGKKCLRLMLKPTIEVKTGTYAELLFINERTNKRIRVSQVLHWAWNGRFLFFCNENPHRVNALFGAGDIITVRMLDDGKDPEKALALAFVHGVDSESSDGGNNKWIDAPARIRWGSSPRDYTVFTVNIRSTIRPGDTYINRQFIITDGYLGMDERASSWVAETYQDLFSLGDLPSSRNVMIFSDDVSFGVIAAGVKNDEDEGILQHCPSSNGSLRCTGNSSPQLGKRALFYITCGDASYVGSDKYHFSLEKNNETNDFIRSYECEGMESSIRPTWKLLGFFEEGSCDLVGGSVYDPNFCSPDSVKEEL